MKTWPPTFAYVAKPHGGWLLSWPRFVVTVAFGTSHPSCGPIQGRKLILPFAFSNFVASNTP
ncbi:hypothetical protein HPP92_010247 [Vanilla planifolia]|uniref:Uncharacterized protein n=1 Tax=Vanilla planifolia TaxID=51239 RepID=A0A835R973_VANPL|nr:hypothetical protein HPP92_010247 [Vanilla planifolia]